MYKLFLKIKLIGFRIGQTFCPSCNWWCVFRGELKKVMIEI